MILSIVASLPIESGAYPSTERVAESSRHPTQPQTLSSVLSSIDNVFGVPLSTEAIPKGSPYEGMSEREELAPFQIDAGETYRSVMKRAVAASGNVYLFEVIRGMSVLRPNPEIVKTPNLLDTVIDLKLDNETIWDALCVLARTVNQMAIAGGGETLSIELNGPQFVELPAPVFLEESLVSIDLEKIAAREAMCAILESASSKAMFNYYYFDYPDEYDFIIVIARDKAGKVIHGERVRDVKKLDYWSTDYIKKLQHSEE